MLPRARRTANPGCAAIPECLEGSLWRWEQNGKRRKYEGQAANQSTEKNPLIFAEEQRQPRRDGPVCCRSNCRAGGAVMLRPRICYVLSLLRIHNPDCKHCAAHLICGNELRKRLEELNEPRQAISDRFPDAGGIAVNVKTKNSHGVRAVQLPATMLQSVKQRNAA